MKLSIVIPAKNEARGLERILPKLTTLHPQAEIIVVDDGSTDDTADVCARWDVNTIRHPYSMGNGASIKAGARRATGDVVVFMDGDGQHQPEDIAKLLEGIEGGYDMVVGARDPKQQSSLPRRIANHFYNSLAAFMTGYSIEDLTSGFRAARLRVFRKFLYLLPNGFSYPTTSTMAFFRSGHSVAYVPISVFPRTTESKSHISPFRDGIRFFIIILRIGALFSPMRLFLPVSFALFTLGLGYYGYTYLTVHRFTNMSTLLVLSSLFVFLIGILSEQVSSLHYRGVDDES